MVFHSFDHFNLHIRTVFVSNLNLIEGGICEGWDGELWWCEGDLENGECEGDDLN